MVWENLLGWRGGFTGGLLEEEQIQGCKGQKSTGLHQFIDGGGRVDVRCRRTARVRSLVGPAFGRRPGKGEKEKKEIDDKGVRLAGWSRQELVSNQ